MMLDVVPMILLPFSKRPRALRYVKTACITICQYRRLSQHTQSGTSSHPFLPSPHLSAIRNRGRSLPDEAVSAGVVLGPVTELATVPVSAPVCDEPLSGTGEDVDVVLASELLVDETEFDSCTRWPSWAVLLVPAHTFVGIEPATSVHNRRKRELCPNMTPPCLFGGSSGLRRPDR